jgi:5-methylcytosine-specific restriction endonuclease McrA
MARYSAYFFRVRPFVLLVFNYRCTLCKIKNFSNHVHHADFNRLNDDFFNLICLCSRCHKIVHKLSLNIDAQKVARDPLLSKITVKFILEVIK